MGELVRMVDVSEKPESERIAVARGKVELSPFTCRRIIEGTMEKGNVLAAAQIAGILAAKKAWEPIPLCHPLPLTHVDVRFQMRPEEGAIDIKAVAKCVGKTGEEMEALAAVAVAALTIYNMVKAVEPSVRIGEIRLVQKKGRQKRGSEAGGWVKIRVFLFASMREAAGASELVAEISEGTVAALLAKLTETYPVIRPYLAQIRVTVNHKFTEPKTRLCEHDEVALIPPVGGGMMDFVRLMEETIGSEELERVISFLTEPEVGAVATFVGVVRGWDGEESKYLEYEAHQALAQTALRQLCAEVKARFPTIRKVAIVHRLGRLNPGSEW